jgi:hypothetical protein
LGLALVTSTLSNISDAAVVPYRPQSDTYAAEHGLTVLTGAKPVPIKQLLLTLSPPIVACTQRKDPNPDEPGFNYCIDWHSAVHAIFALLAISRITGETRFRTDALTAVGGPAEAVQAAKLVEGGNPPGELPYGFGWSLILGTEARRDGISEFNPLAAAASDRLVAWLKGMGPSRLASLSSAQDYSSDTWAIATLLIWAKATGNVAAQRVGSLAARQVLVQSNVARVCGSEAGGTSGFFAPCSLLALDALYSGDYASLSVIERGVKSFAPLQAKGIGIHPAGLNFSRCWGLIAVFEMTKDTEYLALCKTIFMSEIDQPQTWARNYPEYSHWVAQFGVFGLWLLSSFGNRQL